MEKPSKRIAFSDEFSVCPICRYANGFHSVFKKEGTVVKWLFICPSCGELFDPGFDATVNAPGDQ